MQKKINVRLEMQGEMLDRYQKVQSYLGIESGTDLFRYLLSDYFNEKLNKKMVENKIDAQTRTLSEKHANSLVDVFSPLT